MTALSWIKASGATLSGASLRWIKASATGGSAGDLSLNKATAYEPGELVIVTATNGTPPHQWAVIGTLQPTLTIDNVAVTASFKAPATLDGITLTVRYGTSRFINVPILPAGVLVGAARLPASVWVNV